MLGRNFFARSCLKDHTKSPLSRHIVVYKTCLLIWFLVVVLFIFMIAEPDTLFATAFNLFKVDYTKQNGYLNVKVTTDLPNGTPLSFRCVKAGLKPGAPFVGALRKTEWIIDGVAEAKLLIYDLPKGSYILQIYFDEHVPNPPFRDISEELSAQIGKHGENIKTPYVRTIEHFGEKYRVIKYEKVAFTVSEADIKEFKRIAEKEAQEKDRISSSQHRVSIDSLTQEARDYCSDKSISMHLKKDICIDLYKKGYRKGEHDFTAHMIRKVVFLDDFIDTNSLDYVERSIAQICLDHAYRVGTKGWGAR